MDCNFNENRAGSTFLRGPDLDQNTRIYNRTFAGEARLFCLFQALKKYVRRDATYEWSPRGVRHLGARPQRWALLKCGTASCAEHILCVAKR